MRISFRILWFRIDLAPRFRISFDVRRTIVSGWGCMILAAVALAVAAAAYLRFH